LTIVYFDCVAGASGDMILGSLVALGAPLDEIDRKLRALPLDGFTLSESRVVRHGFEAFQLRVDARETKSHRHFTEIRRLLESAKLPERVLARALGTFEVLDHAEAAAHQVPLEKVHFHEVGAVDAIVDIVGTAWALEILGVDRCHASVIPQGRGFVRAAHGVLPVPAPATVRILEGVPVRMTEIEAELTTPTGAALLKALCDTIGDPVGIRPRKTQVVLTVNDRSVADAAVAIEPGRTASVRLPARLPSSGVARIAITDSDGIPADDTRYLVLDAPPLATVALLGEQANGDDLFLLRSAIESGGPDRGFAVEMLGGDARRALGAETARARQVIVVSGTRGLTRETRRVLHDYAWNGGALWLKLWTLDPRSVSTHGAIEHAGKRLVNDAEHTLADFSQSDLDREIAVAIDETVGAVEWIDHPHTRLFEATL